MDPSHGIFVERRLQQLTAASDVRATVVSPVPWFPSRAKLFGRWAAMARIENRSVRGGITVRYPRYPLIPKIGMGTAPYTMACATRAASRAAVSELGGISLIDAHYFFPDGVAACRLSKELDAPFVITARGSDINLIAQFAWPRRQMLHAARNAAAVIAVSDALAAEMRALGMPADKIHVLRNGVDLDFFCPDSGSRSTMARTQNTPCFLSVGALKSAKGHDIAIRFLAMLEEGRLVIAGTGPEEKNLRKLSERLGVSRRVQFAGRLDSESLRNEYREADCLLLMSQREGMPNVVLESLACGTPVIACDVGGIAEVVDNPAIGTLVRERSAEGLFRAWREQQVTRGDQALIRRHAERFSWAETIIGLHELMQRCANTPATRKRAV